jgi:hypothetical protein
MRSMGKPLRELSAEELAEVIGAVTVGDVDTDEVLMGVLAGEMARRVARQLADESDRVGKPGRRGRTIRAECSNR